MVPYFTITYRLLQKNADGSLIPFDSTKGIYTANVVGKTEAIAIDRLKRDFHMLVVDIVAVSDMQVMTVEEYVNNG